MTHPFDQLRGYLDGELPPGAAADLHAHLTHCGACRSQLAAIERLDARLRHLDRLVPPADFATQVLARAATLPALHRTGWRAPLLLLLAGLAALMLGVEALLALADGLAVALDNLTGGQLIEGGSLDLAGAFELSAQAGQPVVLVGLALLGLAGLLLLRQSLDSHQEA